MENKVIFLHSMFRAGSTYMFNKFRAYEKFTTYYEPLHHDLIKLRKDSLDIWKYNKKATNAMNHPSLDMPHFYEFQNAFKSDNEALPFFDSDFSYKEFFSVHKNDELKKYIDNLIDTTVTDTIPVFQFNRTSLRIDWFKKNYSHSLNVFLLRNPHDQFESYVQRGEIGKNIFLAINLYIILLNEKSYYEIFESQKNFELSDSVSKDLAECMRLTKNYTMEEHYKVFFYIWALSFYHARDNSDMIIDMDKMNYDKKHLDEIRSLIYRYSEEYIDFSDYQIKNNDSFLISYDKTIKIEKSIIEKLEFNQTFMQELEAYLTSLNFKNRKKETLFTKLMKKIIRQ